MTDETESQSPKRNKTQHRNITSDGQNKKETWTVDDKAENLYKNDKLPIVNKDTPREETEIINKIRKDPQFHSGFNASVEFMEVLDEKIDFIQKSNMNIFKKMYNATMLAYTQNYLFDKTQRSASGDGTYLKDMEKTLRDGVKVMREQLELDKLEASTQSKKPSQNNISSVLQKLINALDPKKFLAFMNPKNLADMLDPRRLFFKELTGTKTKNDLKEDSDKIKNRKNAREEERTKLSDRIRSAVGNGANMFENMLSAPEYVSQMISKLGSKVGEKTMDFSMKALDMLWDNKGILLALGGISSIFFDNVRKMLKDTLSKAVGADPDSWSDIIAQTATSTVGSIGLGIAGAKIGMTVGSIGGPWGSLIGLVIGSLSGVIAQAIGGKNLKKWMDDATAFFTTKTDEEITGTLKTTARKIRMVKAKIAETDENINKLTIAKKEALSKGDQAAADAISEKIDSLNSEKGRYLEDIDKQKTDQERARESANAKSPELMKDWIRTTDGNLISPEDVDYAKEKAAVEEKSKAARDTFNKNYGRALEEQNQKIMTHDQQIDAKRKSESDNRRREMLQKLEDLRKKKDETAPRPIKPGVTSTTSEVEKRNIAEAVEEKNTAKGILLGVSQNNSSSVSNVNVSKTEVSLKISPVDNRYSIVGAH